MQEPFHYFSWSFIYKKLCILKLFPPHNIEIQSSYAVSSFWYLVINRFIFSSHSTSQQAAVSSPFPVSFFILFIVITSTFSAFWRCPRLPEIKVLPWGSHSSSLHISVLTVWMNDWISRRRVQNSIWKWWCFHRIITVGKDLQGCPVIPSLPCPLNHLPQCHIYPLLENLQGLWLQEGNSCPGQLALRRYMCYTGKVCVT